MIWIIYSQNDIILFHIFLIITKIIPECDLSLDVCAYVCCRDVCPAFWKKSISGFGKKQKNKSDVSLKWQCFFFVLFLFFICLKSKYERETYYTACCCHHSNDLVATKKDFSDPAALQALLGGEKGPCR